MQVRVEARLKCLWLQSFSELGKKNSLAHVFAEDKEGSGFAIVAEGTGAHFEVPCHVASWGCWLSFPGSSSPLSGMGPSLR